MKLAIATEIFRRKDQPVLLDDGKPLTLKEALMISLDNINPEKPLQAAQKLSRGKIFRALENDQSEFKVEEIAEMKKAVGEYPWHPSLHVSLEDLLEGLSDSVK